MSIDPQVLTRFPALAGLPDNLLAGLADNLAPARYRSGSLLCREGSPGESCYFLIEGDARVTKRLSDGRRVRLATLNPGTLFGQSGLVKDQERTADVIAQGDVQLLELHRQQLALGLSKGESWAVSFQNLVAVHLIRQLRSALERLSSLALQQDSSWAIEGQSRADRRQVRSLDVDVTKWKQSGPKKPARGRVDPVAPWEDNADPGANRSEEDQSTMGGDDDPASDSAFEPTAGSAAAGTEDGIDAMTHYGLEDDIVDPVDSLDTQDIMPLDDSGDYEVAEIEEEEDDLILDGTDQSTEAELLRMLQATESSLATAFDLQTVIAPLED